MPWYFIAIVTIFSTLYGLDPIVMLGLAKAESGNAKVAIRFKYDFKTDLYPPFNIRGRYHKRFPGLDMANWVHNTLAAHVIMAELLKRKGSYREALKVYHGYPTPPAYIAAVIREHKKRRKIE